MSSAAAAKGYTFISILPGLLDANGRTIRHFLYDNTHLASLAMPMALDALEAATGWRPDWRAPSHEPPIGPGVSMPPRRVNVAPDARWHMLPSDMQGDANPVARIETERLPSVSTDPERGQFLLDTRTMRLVDEIRVRFVRPEDAAARDIAVETSVDMRRFKRLKRSRSAGAPDRDGWWVCRMPPELFRGLRIRHRKKPSPPPGWRQRLRDYVAPKPPEPHTGLAVGEVEILAYSYE
jgi:hypothetical protein